MSKSTKILDQKNFERTIIRLAHEILEKNRGAENLVLVGIRTRGEFLAIRIAKKIKEIEHREIPVGLLDITLYRDDLRENLSQPILKGTDVKFDISGRDVILVDDVLFTGRTIRAALDELVDLGRPSSIQLAVLIDRGHRELPIRADFVGKNIPTSVNEKVKVSMKEADGEDSVNLIEISGGEN